MTGWTKEMADAHNQRVALRVGKKYMGPLGQCGKDVLTASDHESIIKKACKSEPNPMADFVNREIAKTKIASVVKESERLTHHEPDDFRREEAEQCVVCKNPTRTWRDPHTPMHEECARIGHVEISRKSNPLDFSVGDVQTCKKFLQFTVKIDPMGAPRQTRADAWKKRPVVLRYRAYSKALQMAFSEACGGDLPVCPDRLDFVAHIAMPDSWSEKKKVAMDGRRHKSVPDTDNLWKSCSDPLFKNDSGISEGHSKKLWCRAGQQRLEIAMYWL